MSDPVEHHPVENVIARLTERFPSLSRDACSRSSTRSSLASRVAASEYVPALVEHAADERLREEADPVRVTSDPGGPPVVADDASDMDSMEIERKAREQRADSSSATSVADPSDGSFAVAFRSVVRGGTLHAWRRRGSTRARMPSP